VRDHELRDTSSPEAGEYEPPAISAIGSVDGLTRAFDAGSLDSDDLTGQ
jgi:hypothetical protein